jgi:PBP1b-binding outer membrane lipoprotein LpoB
MKYVIAIMAISLMFVGCGSTKNPEIKKPEVKLDKAKRDRLYKELDESFKK